MRIKWANVIGLGVILICVTVLGYLFVEALEAVAVGRGY